MTVIGVELELTSLHADANHVSHWRMEGNSTDDKDSNNGTDTGITYSAANGKFGQGAGFASGSSSKIVIADAANLKIVGNFSVSVWIKTTQTTEIMIFQCYSENSNPAGYHLTLSQGNSMKARFPVGKNTGVTKGTDWEDVLSTNALNDGIWHHIVALFDGSYIRMYVDGSLNNSTAWTSNLAYAASNYIRIGCRNLSGTDDLFSTITIDDVAVFSKALSAPEISGLYNGRFINTLNQSNQSIHRSNYW